MTKQATTYKYTPSRHAIDRLALRFGVEADKATKWVNDKMRKAKYVASNGRNGLTYEIDDARIVVDGDSNVVITIHHKVTTDFLQPALERELRKLKRQHTKKSRQLELDRALTLRKYAEGAVNHANARNPNTRDLIADRMTELHAIADGYTTRIKRLTDEYDARVRAIELISG